MQLFAIGCKIHELQFQPGIERVQALADISRSRYVVSNETRAPIENPPNNAQLGGTSYYSPKLRPGPCSSVGMRRWTDRQTDTQTCVSNRAAINHKSQGSVARRVKYCGIFSERELTFTFAICCRPSVCLSVVCLSVVGNTRAPYSGGSKNFRQYFYGIWYPSHPLTSTENFTEIVPGEPLRRGS